MQTHHTPLSLVDPFLPGLDAATDAGTMLETFRKHLRPIGRDGYEILHCRLSRIRHREAERCILQYALRVSEPGTSSERTLLVSGSMYAEQGKAERIWLKLRATDPVAEIPESMRTFEPVSFIPELDMLVQIFPYDRRLPGLRRLAAGPPPALESLLLSRLGSDDRDTGKWEVETVRYREQLGAVLRYEAPARVSDTGTNFGRSFYVKVYRDDAGKRTYRLLRGLEGRTGADFAVAKPVAYLGDLRALILEEAPGVSLEQALLRGSDAASATRRVARALADFNQVDLRPERRHELGSQVAVLERAAGILCRARPDLGPEIREIAAVVMSGLGEVPLKPTHRDLKPDHVFLDDDRVTFVDLDSFAAADPVLDPAFLLARLVAMPHLLPVSRSRTLVAARAFANEYFARVPDAWRGRLHLHYAGALLEVAHGLFRRQEPGWPEKVAALVGEAKASLDAHGPLMAALTER